jgi:Fe-S cluster assembly ATP-binding protein
MLKIANLRAEIDGNEIIKGLDLEVGKGEIHAIMGPNGSGKSTLSNVLMGHPRYEVTDGTVTFMDQDVFELEADERAKLGMFLAFQYPSEVPGVSVANFLRTAVNAVRDVQASPGEDAHHADGPQVRRAIPKRGVLRRREEAQRDPADAHARA